jgi:hypothetical protein
MKIPFQLYAEMKIPFQLAISISAGWRVRRLRACAHLGQPYRLSRLDKRVFVWYLYGELAGSRDHKFIFWSPKFISANRFHFSS